MAAKAAPDTLEPHREKHHRTAAESRLLRVLSSLATGLTVGALTIIQSVSFAALIFSGPLSGHVAQGIGIALATAAVAIRLVVQAAAIGVLRDRHHRGRGCCLRVSPSRWRWSTRGGDSVHREVQPREHRSPFPPGIEIPE